ncbi:NOT2/NOT3/NOT5 C-terminal domain-containing protein [Plasmodiophora brassicae]
MTSRDFILASAARQAQQQQMLQQQQQQQQQQQPQQQSAAYGMLGLSSVDNGYAAYGARLGAPMPSMRSFNGMRHDDRSAPSMPNHSFALSSDASALSHLNEYGDINDVYSLPLGYGGASQRDMAILSKGAGHMLPHAHAQPRIDNVPVFDMSEDFPALGSTTSKASSALNGTTSATARNLQAPQHYGPQPGLIIRNNEVEFPALGSTVGDRIGDSRGIGYASMVSHAQQQQQQQQHQQQQQSPEQQPAPIGSSAARSSSKSKFGLQGLLGVIRMTDPDRNTLALGTDLTTLGLNLNSADVLYPTFASPWADAPSRREPDYILPYCYYRQPPALKTSHFSKFQLETLFYVFYNMPKDMLQVFAAKELYAREWKYHPELKLWFARPSDVAMAQLGYAAGTYVYFDTSTWERRVYPREHSDALTFMSDEEITMM